mmetsp:Transcript_89274/g.251230  ORF Transcript_89274/g.251230 Transcript_89274/m.251230 type:complete len:211 (-) Transcript_89274:354-986(-)
MERRSAWRSSSSMSSIPMASMTAASEAIGNGAEPEVGSVGAAAGCAAGVVPSPVGAAAAPPSAKAWFWFCLALSSSMEMRNAIASSGSSLMLMPNSKPSPPPPATAPPSPSLFITVEPKSTSLRSFGPTGTSNKCDVSLLFTAPRSFSSFCVFSSTSPKLTKSRETLFFFKFLPKVSSSFSVAVTGLPTKAMIRCFWFLFCRCLSASWAV